MDVTAERIFISRHSEDSHGRNYFKYGTWHPLHGFSHVIVVEFRRFGAPLDT